jgi:hypothetical protein
MLSLPIFDLFLGTDTLITNTKPLVIFVKLRAVTRNDTTKETGCYSVAHTNKLHKPCVTAAALRVLINDRHVVLQIVLLFVISHSTLSCQCSQLKALGVQGVNTI